MSQQRTTFATGVAALAYCYAFNVLLLMVVGHGYLGSVPSGTSALGWVATLVAFVSNFAILALAPAILASVTIFLRRRWLMLTAAVILFGLLNVLIYADFVIYQLWRFHFNGMVWNLLTSPGAGDNAIVGKSTLRYCVVIAASIFAAEIGFAAVVLPRLRFGNKRTVVKLCLAVAGLIVLDKTIYDVGDFRGDVEFLRAKQLFPFYQPVTVKKLAIKVLGIRIATDKQPRVQNHGGSFNYPKAPLRFPPNGPRPNVLIIPIEGGRFDMLTPEVMPFLSRWSQDNLVFENNYSTGNTTRYGIFGLLYGIDGTYWQRALTEHVGPTMMKSLKDLGYKFRILCSADMNYPELHSTCFADVQDAITDQWQCERVQRDVLMTDELIKFLDRTQGAPFFGFVFYDASHQPYRYPPEHAVFNTGNVTEDINYIKLAHEPGDMELIRNRYKNSMHYVDAEIERLLQALQQRGLMDNTLVFVMGDHGEEFRELGLFGHNSSFNQYQTKTLMVAHIPGESPRRIQHLTSHLDVPATILNYMRAQNPPADYTQGISLTSAQERPYVFIASWDTAAIFDGETTTVFGTEAYKSDMTVLDRNYSPFPNQREALAAKKSALLDALNGMKSFTK